MRSLALFAVAGLATLSLAACSDEHATQIKEGAKAGQETKEAAADLNTDAKKAGSNAKKEVHEATR